jgi:hypothetical protein
MSLEQTVDNLEIRYANAVTFVGTSNTMIDTTTGRIQTKGIQHNSNVITDVSGPHGRVAPTLKKYPEIVFDASKLDGNDSTNTYTQAGYTVSASTTYSTHRAFKAFNGVPNDFFHWQVGSFSNSDGTYSGGTQSFEGTPGEWLKIEVPNKIKPTSINLYRRDFDGQSPKDFKIYASITGSSWTLLTEQTGIDNWTNAAKLYNFDTGIYYKYFAILVTKITRTNTAGAQTSGTLGEIELYGYEEYTPAGDHSVDTTFMSRFNNPQLTGVQVLVDGATGQGTNQISGGPDPSGNQSTYVTDGKYWTLNGTLTSNLSVEANTFLEGDQPHAVSVWFNSSNLEANVSNTCVFSISDQEKLDSVNLDLQSNTWHNLTYAYQGEGGSRVTYLDGRKVAEDQAEDTFGDYPPFAMTGYSQGGYVVSASSEYSNFLAWEAFNDITGSSSVSGHWSGANTNYPSANGIFNGGTSAQFTTNVEGVSKYGDWLQIEFPHKVKYSYSTILAPYDHEERLPRDGYIVGSNDGNSWTTLHRFEDMTRSTVTETVTYTPPSAPTQAFKYFRIVIEATSSGGGNYAGIDQWDIYGHRENDLVRLPDPTNVLKYPHIAMTGPAQRGYVASASSNYSSGTPGSELRDFGAFSGAAGTGYGQSWLSGASKYSYVNGSYTASPQEQHHTGSAYGEWLQIEMPHKIQVTKFILQGRPEAANSNQGLYTCFKTGEIWGSVDGTNWVEVVSSANFGTFTPSTLTQQHTLTVNSTSSYKYFAIIVKSTNAQNTNTGFTFAGIGEWQIYGTGVDSIPIQIGGGNIDKVANFRVYDKFVGGDQALEIWDAQKDEFGRAKSSMTLQKGRLGIGTTEPEGRLAVLDEPHILEEFPPRAMTGYKTYMEGHGEFRVSVSNVLSESYTGYKAFNKNSTATTGNWWTQSDSGGQPTYSTLTGEFSSTDSLYSTNVEGATKFGQWLQIEFPYKINYKYSDIQAPQHSIGRQPHTGYILGSNDLSGMWTSLHRFTNVTRTHAYESVRYTPPTVSTQTFKYFRLVIEELNNYQYAGIARWDIFGTREQGQSVLHDGQLTLTKNLTVSRIGPALDADDTPRRDRLVVEYNTSTNPTFEGAVRDTSGRGNDGIMYNGASYDATEKALKFVGSSSTTANSSDKIQSTYDWGSTAPAHTFSVWFKRTENLTDWEWICSFGQANNTGGNPGILISADTHTEGGNIISFDTFNDQVTVQHTVELGVWTHVVATFNAVSTAWSVDNCKIYVNGELKAGTNADARTFNLVGNEITLGATHEGKRGFTGCISNFKLYDTALTASEVKTLYDMGRNGSVANPQPLHIAAPLYSPGAIVQVQYASTPLNNTVKQTIVGGELSDAANDIDYLDVNFKPKFANSSILLVAMIVFSPGFVTSFGFKEDNTTIRTQGDNNNTPGGIFTYYDSTNLSNDRIKVANIQVMIPANGAHTRRYNAAAASSWNGGNNYTLTINERGSNDMRGMSNMVVYEIAN